MKRYILTPQGKIISILEGDYDAVTLNTASNAIFVDSSLVVEASTHYWDFNLFSFIYIGLPPSQCHEFNFALKEWIDPRTIQTLKDQKWAQIKSDRDKLEFGGFIYNGHIFDSDQISQGRIIGAAMAGIDQVWTTADNNQVNLSASELSQLYTALQQHVSEVHARGRIARAAINLATSKEEIQSVTL